MTAGCAGNLQRPNLNSGVEKVAIKHDMLFGEIIIPQGSVFPVYKSETERMIFLQVSPNDLSYGLVLNDDLCHNFDGVNGMRSQSSFFGFTKDACVPFCAAIEPKQLCFEQR